MLNAARYIQIWSRFFYEVVDQVDAEPVTLTLDRPKDREAYELVINGDRLIGAFYDLLFWTDELPRLPELIFEINAGEWERFASMIQNFQFGNDNFSEGMRFSVRCAEEMSFSSPEQAQTANAAVNPRLSAVLNNAVEYQICAVWVVTPAWGMIAAENLSQAQILVFPGVAHGVLGSFSQGAECSSHKIVDAFLSDPESPIEASCVAEAPVLFGGD